MHLRKNKDFLEDCRSSKQIGQLPNFEQLCSVLIFIHKLHLSQCLKFSFPPTLQNPHLEQWNCFLSTSSNKLQISQK